MQRREHPREHRIEAAVARQDRCRGGAARDPALRDTRHSSTPVLLGLDRSAVNHPDARWRQPEPLRVMPVAAGAAVQVLNIVGVPGSAATPLALDPVPRPDDELAAVCNHCSRSCRETVGDIERATELRQLSLSPRQGCCYRGKSRAEVRDSLCEPRLGFQATTHPRLPTPPRSHDLSLVERGRPTVRLSREVAFPPRAVAASDGRRLPIAAFVVPPAVRTSTPPPRPPTPHAWLAGVNPIGGQN